ncbi:MAG: putative response regulator [Labilithrix sp.]|nr:putative response regulator [Labilithrix sp.]
MKRVLVVDDELTVAEVIQFVLSMEGFSVDVASDGRHALEQLSVQRPDLVVTDMMMPYVDGVELARTIHETPELRDLPVIIMSATEEPPTHAAETYAAFLRKPFDVETLVTTVGRVLDGHDSE